MNYRVGTSSNSDTAQGFTIVELLIVIVVIAILAAITLVSYNSIQKQAVAASVQSTVSQVNQKILMYYADKGVYPATLADADVNTANSSALLDYSSDATATPQWYQLTGLNAVGGSAIYSVSSVNPQIQTGAAQGSNLVFWDKKDNSTAPIAASAGVAIDTSVYRTATASMRIAPSNPGKLIRANPVTGDIGQVVRVSAWMKTDSTWNGTSGNSKIRFGLASTGALITACAYDGVKTTWTQVNCSWTLSSATPAVAISFGNDGSTGNIWLDDINVSVR